MGKTLASYLHIHSPGGSRTNPMPLVNALLVLIIVGVILWLVTTYIPMAQPIKTVITVVVVLVLCLWLLSLFGIGDIYIGHHP